MALFCVINTNCGTGDFFVNGPFPTKEAAQLCAAALADEQLGHFKEEDPDTKWELDTEDGLVSIKVNGEYEVEYSVVIMVEWPAQEDK
jgi:hypothetical protein